MKSETNAMTKSQISQTDSPIGIETHPDNGIHYDITGIGYLFPSKSMTNRSASSSR